MKIESDQLPVFALNSLSHQTDEDGYVSLFRFSENQMNYYAENSFFHLMSLCSSGVCLYFGTDGNQVTLDCRTADLSRKMLVQIREEMSLGEILQRFGETVIKVNQARSRLDIVQHFDLYQDDHYCRAVRTGNNEINLKLDNPEHQNVIVKIWLPLFKTLSIRSLASDGAIWPVESGRPRLLALGDSITQGFVAGKPSLSYVTQLAELLEVDAINQGIGNITHEAGILTDWENLPCPDLVISAYGTNDWHSGKDMTEIELAMRAYYERLFSVFSEVPIYILTPIWRDDFREAKSCGSFSELTECIRTIVRESGREKTWLMDGLSVSPHNPACYSDGWLHPNVTGFSYMASRLYRIMKNWNNEVIV
ncbi:MAG: SGNH/GDSL hydrolase family protein [Clostridia bacterium]|nr:SGNH/GDSL hydrolase family protein [Clostridia bacterium]